MPDLLIREAPERTIAPDGATPRDVEATLGIGAAAPRGRGVRRWLLRVVVPVVVVAAGAMYFRMRNAPAPVHYRGVEARVGAVAASVTATGTLAALDTVDVGTEVSGVVDLVSVDYNDRVRQGETLAVVNTDLLQAQIRQAEASLQAAEASAEQTAATVIETRPQEMRAESLYNHRMMSDQDFQSAQAELARAVAADANARALVQASSAALAAEQTQLDKATIRSPIDGVVLQRQIEPGRTVAASFQTPVLFVLAADLRRMTLALDIDEADVGQVGAGQAADFTVDAYPDRTFTARVRSVRNAAKTVEGVVTYQAILDVTNRDLALRPGMTATASVKTASAPHALLVPNAALRFSPVIDTTALARPVGARPASAHRVWMLRGGVPVAIPVAVGITDGQWTQLLSGDVEAGDVVLTGVLDATAGR